MYYRNRQGYIEQQIEALALVLAKIIDLKDLGDYPAAQFEAASAFYNVSKDIRERVKAFT